MSSYSCVIPVNWSLLWEQVIPAWLSVLEGETGAVEFYKKYVPAGDDFGDFIDERALVPLHDLTLFTEPLEPPYLRATLHDSGKCLTFLQPDFPYLLSETMKQTAAVTLPGDDPFADNYLASFAGPSRTLQVAGTKNLYDFLENAFEVIWNATDGLYTYSRLLQGASPQLQGLLESLLLYQRVIPGSWFPARSPSWPGSDDISFAGYLSPPEVKSLSDQLAFWGAPPFAGDEEFLLFSDRVKRSAESAYGLLTIHAGL